MMFRIAQKAVVISTLLFTVGATAQTVPEKPIRLIQQFASGGGSDAVARPLQPELEKILGQPVIVENRPGANGGIANQAVSKAPADGYTLLFAAAGPMTAAPHLYDLRIAPNEAFTPVALAVKTPYAIIINNSVKASSLKELIDLARANPGKLTFGTSGVGGAPHLAGEMLSAVTGVKFLPVAYKGMGPALTAVLGGEVDFVFADIAFAAPHVNSDRVKIVAVTGGKRSAPIPNIPTVRELGVADYEAGTWYGVFVPVGTPPAIIETLNKAVNKALEGPLRARFIEQGMDPASNMSSSEFVKFVKTEYDHIGKVVKQANIKIEQ
jgi:tripartite-type tricarboxylate transporter receptor subunit TctC